MKTPTNFENLKTLIEKLNSLPEELLDMNVFECGTAACVAGWTVRWFDEWYMSPHGPRLKGTPGVPGIVSVQQEMARFFGGTDTEWSNIIYAEEYKRPTKDLVIKRINELCNRLSEINEHTN